MNDPYQSLIETESAAIVQLLSDNWQDSQGIDEWKRIAFQLNGAAIISRKDQMGLADELEFLSGLALNRVYIMEALIMDKVVELQQLQRMCWRP